ncbi:MAG TPA: tetratricopeptide repeat protein [Flavobacterium sp.]|nr:tetratricopeptide repeat protein [Flavobacterium sp.]
MNKILLYLIMCLPLLAIGQNDQLAQNYFDKGEFEKALISYQDLLKLQPSQSLFFQRVVESYQQLEQLDNAEKAINERLDKYKQAALLVDLGYNYHLRKDEAKANKYYDQALDRIRKNPSEVYGVAAAFERKALVEKALQSYKIATEEDPRLSFNYQVAQLYGQAGDTDMMISTFLDEAVKNPNSSIMIQNQLSRFMSEEGETTFNDALRKALLTRAQKDQDIFWNHFLSWYFVQRKEYGKAFIQEKAIYKREPETFSNIVNLAQLAIEENDDETAAEILGFVLENTQDLDVLVQSQYFLTQMRVNKAAAKDYAALETHLKALLEQFGISPYTLSLQILQAHFVTFNLNRPEEGRTILRAAMELPLNKYQMADVKMELADILLFEEKFNQALIYYSQIEEDLKNDAIGHEASLKAAKTSYFKSDFLYAQSQFKVLKSASSQLIANDALEYFLLINDNTVADSTQTALKKFARADYLLYQKNSQEALTQFQAILKEFKGDEIEAVTLLRLGKIYKQLGDYNTALNHFQQIIDKHAEAIYVDEALYFSAEIYNTNLKDVEKAKALYEKILFGHEDSIYFIDARKKFRQLRGDANL